MIVILVCQSQSGFWLVIRRGAISDQLAGVRFLNQDKSAHIFICMNQFHYLVHSL